MSFFTELNARNRAGAITAIPSVCSAHPDVLRASLMLARDLATPVLIEATSNQVNQFGGYTGMKPADFISFVENIAKETGIDMVHVHFGGDHLGPQAWRGESSDTAMAHAEDMMRSYVKAGFTKIHIDCSEGCAGEPAQVSDAVSAERAAQLAVVCEDAAPDPTRLHYVIGTEVPPPGGMRADEDNQATMPTDPAHAGKTLKTHLMAFKAFGIEQAWTRVIGLVVQPGLEFAPTHIDHFDLRAPDKLSSALADYPHICFEAHSTDYQYPEVFPELARRHFTVLKVGPALTFAYRQALYALDHLRNLQEKPGTGLIDKMEKVMLEHPHHWQKHYVGGNVALRLQRHFSYADRIRYYWPKTKSQKAVMAMFSDIGEARPFLPMLEQCFAPGVVKQANRLETQGVEWTKALVIAQIQQALRPYFFG